MAITLTSNYKEVLQSETVVFIDNLVEEGYDLEDILLFVDDYNEENIESYEEYEDALNSTNATKVEMFEYLEKHEFSALEYAEKYFELAEDCSEEAVDTFIELYSIDDLRYFEESYQGSYGDVEDFVENLLEGYDLNVPTWLCIDYRETWRTALQYDYSEQDGYFFRDF
jgi:hypothetical protein